MVHIKEYVSDRNRIVPPFLRRLVEVSDIRTEPKQLAINDRAGSTLRKPETKEPQADYPKQRQLSQEKQSKEKNDAPNSRLLKPWVIAEQAKLGAAFAAETVVGVGAALWGLRVLSEIPRMEEAKRTKDRELRTIRTKRRKDKSRVSTEENSPHQPMPLSSREKKKRWRRRSKEKLIWRRKQSRELLSNQGKREKKSKLRSAVARVSSKEKTTKLQERLRRTLAYLARKMSKDLHLQPSHKRQIKDGAFSFAWAVWWWLKLDRRLRERAAPKKQKTITTEALVSKEPTPWILLAIIWYLARLREQGLRNVPQNQKNHKKTKKSVAPLFSLSLPPQGVIFTFNS
jgi:hypothetical protein